MKEPIYKLKSVSAVNFAGFDQITCSFSDDVTYLTGPNGASKTSAGVNLLWVTLQGYGEKAQSKDVSPIIGQRWMVIGDKGKTAKTGIVLRDTVNNYDIVVKRKITQTGTELSFEAPDNAPPLDQAFLNSIFNLFLISPRKFLQLTPVQQSIALGIDLSSFDKELKGLKEDYTLLNRDLRGIGEVVKVQAVEPIDVSALVEEKKRRSDFNVIQKDNGDNLNNATQALTKLADERAQMNVTITELTTLSQTMVYTSEAFTSSEAMDLFKTVHPMVTERMRQLKANIDLYSSRIKEGTKFVSTIPAVMELLDITELDQQIASASEINVNASKYQEYVKLRDKKALLEKELESNKAKQDEVTENRTERIKSYELPFADLEINDDGELMLKGRYLSEVYFSTGELIRTIPMLIISSMKRKGEILFPFCFIQDFSLLDDENQKSLIAFFAENNIQVVIEMVSSKPTGLKNEIFLKDNVIVSET